MPNHSPESSRSCCVSAFAAIVRRLPPQESIRTDGCIETRTALSVNRGLRPVAPLRHTQDVDTALSTLRRLRTRRPIVAALSLLMLLSAVLPPTVHAHDAGHETHEHDRDHQREPGLHGVHDDHALAVSADLSGSPQSGTVHVHEAPGSAAAALIPTEAPSVARAAAFDTPHCARVDRPDTPHPPAHRPPIR
jgi:hypothetical protein